MKFIVSHKESADKEGLKKQCSLEEILHSNNASVIDGSMLPKIATIEVNSKDVPALKESLGESWSLFQEKQYKIPTTKHRLAKTGI